MTTSSRKSSAHRRSSGGPKLAEPFPGRMSQWPLPSKDDETAFWRKKAHIVCTLKTHHHRVSPDTCHILKNEDEVYTDFKGLTKGVTCEYLVLKATLDRETAEKLDPSDEEIKTKARNLAKGNTILRISEHPFGTLVSECTGFKGDKEPHSVGMYGLMVKEASLVKCSDCVLSWMQSQPGYTATQPSTERTNILAGGSHGQQSGMDTPLRLLTQFGEDDSRQTGAAETDFTSDPKALAEILNILAELDGKSHSD